MEILFLISVIWIGQSTRADSFYKFKHENVKSYSDKYECSDIELTEREGIISSPNYPALYSSHLSCSWHILGNVGDVITLSFQDVDIEESCSILPGPCCLFNWLKIGLLSNDTEKKLCGKSFKYESIVSSSHKLWIKFHISKFVQGGRGFQLYYKITPRIENECKTHEFRCGNSQCIPAYLRCNGMPDCEDRTDEHHCTPYALHSDCKITEFKCGNTECIPSVMRCDGETDCEDGSDELFCSNKCITGHSCQSYYHCYNPSQHCDGIADCSDFSDENDCGFCQENFIRCGANTTQCYNPITQRCDKVFHCLNGADETDCYDLCPGLIVCNSKRGCYPIKHRCNGVAQCEDASDEKNCVPELCNYEHGGFLCDNRRCIQQVWTCDHTDDCGDGSDERNCLRNSVLTAAVMGSLICALLLVIAISCTCRLHALRMLEQRLSSRETPLSRLSREFFFREPPPSYAVAVQGSQHHNLYVENLHYGVPVHRGRRRSRRSRHSRTAPPLPPRNSALTSPGDSVSSPEVIDVSLMGESSNPVPSAGLSSVVNPGTKNECVITVPGECQSMCKNTDDISVQSDNTYPVIRANSDSESLSLEPINASFEETSDSVQNTDHYYCDSDSEPLVA